MAIVVRMYRVGFGECFLLSFPTGDGVEHVLIDCGVHPDGDEGTIATVVQDIADRSGGELALVVATHAHQDHVSGFATHADLFRTIRVREVWLPWTESPAVGAAVAVRQGQQALAAQLTEHLAVRPAAQDGPSLAAALANLANVEEAMHLLRSGLNGGTVRYVAAGQQHAGAGGIAALSARVLWPPRDDRFLAHLELSPDERLLRAGADGAVVPINGLEPCDRRWEVPQQSSPYYRALDDRDRNLLAMAAVGIGRLGFSLDRCVNDTSIVVRFSYHGQQLLFGGDAHVDDWARHLGPEEVRDLLAGVALFKVPHHGSRTATSQAILDLLPARQFVALVSTHGKPWDSLPCPDLLAGLGAAARAVVRSDAQPVDSGSGDIVAGPFWIDTTLPI